MNKTITVVYMYVCVRVRVCDFICDYTTALPNLFMKKRIPSKIFPRSKQSVASRSLR